MRRDTVRTALVNGAILALGLVTSIQLARWLGPTGRGELAAAMLWPTLLVYLFSFGLIPAVLYHTAQPGGHAGRIFATAASTGVLQSALAVLFGWLALPMLLKSQTADVVAASRLFLLVVPINILGQYGISVLQSRQRFRVFNALRLVLPVGYLAGVAGLHATGEITIRNVIVLLLALSALVLIGTMGALWRSGLLAGARPDPALVRPLLRYGAQVHVGTMSQAANMRIDQALLSAFFPPAQLGLYVAAVSASSVMAVVSTSVTMVATPKLAAQTAPDARRELLRRLFRRYLAASLGAALVLAAVTPFAIPLLFGPAFRDAIPVALILILAMTLLGAKDVLAGAAQAFGTPWLASRSELVGAGVMLVTLPILLPVLGIAGAALTAVFTYSTQLLVVLLGLRRLHDVSPRGLFRMPRRPIRPAPPGVSEVAAEPAVRG